MNKYEVSFDLNYKEDVKHIEVMAIEVELYKDVLRIAELTTGATLEWNTKDISNLIIKLIN